MKPGEYKIWKPGEVNNLWEVLISSRDLLRVEETINSLVYILADSGSTIEQGLEHIKTLSGEIIVKALVEYKNSHIAGIKKGLKNE